MQSLKSDYKILMNKDVDEYEWLFDDKYLFVFGE